MRDAALAYACAFSLKKSSLLHIKGKSGALMREGEREREKRRSCTKGRTKSRENNNIKNVLDSMAWR